MFLNERGQKGGTQIRELALSRCLFAGKKSIDQRQLAAALYRREQSRGVAKPAYEGRRERKKIKLGKKREQFQPWSSEEKNGGGTRLRKATNVKKKKREEEKKIERRERGQFHRRIVTKLLARLFVPPIRCNPPFNFHYRDLFLARVGRAYHVPGEFSADIPAYFDSVFNSSMKLLQSARIRDILLHLSVPFLIGS